MANGIPFGLGAMPIPNANADDVRRLLLRAPFDPSQAPPLVPVAASESPEPARQAPGELPGSVARLFDPRQLGPSAGFSGTSGRIVDMTEAPLPPPRPSDLSVPLRGEPPALRKPPFGIGGAPVPSQPQAEAPTMDAVPIQAQRAPNGLPNAVPAASDEPSMLDQLMSGIRKSDGLLTSLGIGLMTQRGLGPAVAAGLQHHQGAEKARAATDLAKAELGLKQRKLAQETAAMGGNVALLKRAYPDLSDTEAMSAAGNGSLVTEALKRLQNRNAGREMRADGSGSPRWVDTGELVFPGDSGPQFVQNRDEQGNVWNVNQRTGQQTVALKADGASGEEAKIAARERALQSRGIDPKDPRNEDFLLTGKRPREDQAKLTAGDKKAINEAEDQSIGIDGTLETLARAKELNRKTYTGYSAGMRGWIGTALPDAMVPDGLADPRTASDTREFNQIMSLEAIKSMSQTLKGATTNQEMSRFMEILGDPTTPPDIRERTIDRMTVLARRQKDLAQSRITDMRGGTYYQPKGAEPETAAQPAKPSAPRRLRFDPATGAMN